MSPRGFRAIAFSFKTDPMIEPVMIDPINMSEKA
jgi:hypothetical protein